MKNNNNNDNNNNLFEIKQNVAIPKITRKGKKGKLRMSLEILKVGEMIETEERPKNIYILQNTLNMKFLTREIDGGKFGIWRKS